MRRLLLAALCVAPIAARAQSLFIYPPASTAPRGSYQTITAIVQGVNDKTVTWTTDGGSLVGTNPCVVNEPCTIALYTTTPGTYHVTATSNANGSMAGTSTVTFTATPTPKTDHPRLIVTSDMLSALRAKAVAGNTVYTQLKARANLMMSGHPNDYETAYDCAFLSLIAPTQGERDTWGAAARTALLYQMNGIVGGSIVIGGNTWSDMAGYLVTPVDWLMGGGYLSSADKAVARSFLAYMAKYAITNIYGATTPIGGYNAPSSQLTAAGDSYADLRSMGNNYTHSKAIILAAAALTFNDDTIDDPTLSNCAGGRYVVCNDGTANSLRAYWTYLTGGVLYRYWAHLEDPGVSRPAYHAAFSNMPTTPMCNQHDWPAPCLGDGRGGESSEGNWYGFSLSKVLGALNMIQSSGMNDPISYGPQLSLATSSFWDLTYISELAFLTGASTFGGACNYGSGTCWNYFTTGDSNNYERIPSDYQQLAALLTSDSYVGRSDHQGAMWAITNTAQGGIANFATQLGNDLGRGVAVDLFISQAAGNPTSPAPSDPRPSIPTDIFSAGNGHVTIRSGYGASDVAFSYHCQPATTNDHEHQFCGRFEVFSKGEYITKGRTEFTNYNDLMTSAAQSNLVAYTNPMTPTGCGQGCLAGGQWWHGYEAGLVSLAHAELPAYAATDVDSTNDYNSTGYLRSTGITHASRTLIYLRGTNQVVFYDRGVSSPAADKTLYQVATGPLTIAGSTASWPTRSSNQKVYLTSLLPAGATVANAGNITGESYPQSSDWEPYARVSIDAGSVASARFLSVMEWGASSLTKSTTTLVQSSAGTGYDGALVGSSLAMFKRNWGDMFSTVTYPASGATTHYVANLTPGATYTLTGAGVPGTATADTSGTITFAATGTGDVTVTVTDGGAPTLTSIALSPSSASKNIGQTQVFVCTATWSDGSTASCASTGAWTSSVPAVATVATPGVATAVGEGSTTIRAVYGGLAGTATFSVLPTKNYSTKSHGIGHKGVIWK